MPSFWQRLLGDAELGKGDASPSNRRRHKRTALRLLARLEWRDTDGDLQECRGLIRDITTEGIQVECEWSFPVHQTIDIEDDTGGVARYVVRHCRETPEHRYLIGLLSLPQEQRREVRLAASGIATLRWLGEGSRPQSCSVKVRDISASGIQIECPSSLEVGARVKIGGEAFSRPAVVRFCNHTNDGFRAGLELLD